MADIIDSASEIEELQRNTAIKIRRLNLPDCIRNSLL